ncbi:MAG: ATP-binding protein [DPANN group archaeon]|nr:ATP-binding protein [DPANN group archaeon]
MYIPRLLEGEIKRHIKRKEIVAVIGPRQVGKTTLINHLLKDFKRVKTVSFDDLEAKNLFETNTDAFVKLYIEGYDYLFIDEIQYSGSSGRILKYIYDTQDIKIFISGSSAAEVSIKSLKFLVGRVFIYHLFPFSFKEFLAFKDKSLASVLAREKIGGLEKRFHALVQEFILFGGYPEVVLAKDEQEKKLILKNIYNTYFLREIRDIFGLSEDYRLSRLLKALSLQIGNLINYAELATLSGTSAYGVKKFLNILEKTFICRESKNFHTNKRSELKKSPKIFFIDPGIRNISINNFSKERGDIGALYENFIAAEMIKQDVELKYWRTRSGGEVDFVIEKEGRIIPIEIKTIISNKNLGRSFHSFIETYAPKDAFVLSLNFSAERTIGTCRVHFRRIVEIANILNA